jgi:hypothetical protein
LGRLCGRELRKPGGLRRLLHGERPSAVAEWINYL